MKNLFLVLIGLSTAFNSFSQVFYSSYYSKEIKALQERGIIYFKSGNEEEDKKVIDALEKYWKVSSYRVLDYSLEESITDKDVIFKHMVVKTEGGPMSGEDIFGLISAKYFGRKDMSVDIQIGYMYLNGFTQSADLTYAEFVVKGLNDCLAKIIQNKISGRGVGLYTSISRKINEKASVINEKTLLILNDTDIRLNIKDLDKSGIKYKVVSQRELYHILRGDTSKYCLLYFAYNTYTEASIFDLSDYSLIYTWRYVSAHDEFDHKDIRRILK